MAKKHDKPEFRSAKAKFSYPRRLKVHSGHYDYQFTNTPSGYRKPIPVPWIQIKGYWLDQANFFKGPLVGTMPSALRVTIQSKHWQTWYKEYLKPYRDAMVHRIPMYIPPYIVIGANRELYSKYKALKQDAMRQSDYDLQPTADAEQDKLGEPCFLVVPALSEETPVRPLQLHSQLICDSGAVVELGRIFLENGGESA